MEPSGEICGPVRSGFPNSTLRGIRGVWGCANALRGNRKQREREMDAIVKRVILDVVIVIVISKKPPAVGTSVRKQLYDERA